MPVIREAECRSGYLALYLHFVTFEVSFEII